MASIVQGFEYDIFISYRHNDNLDGWVTEFVQQLERELRATLKEPLTIYFDKNPHDGLLETHNVGQSLDGKLKCLIFIPIVSQTYCDPKSFAWQHEFCAFNKLSKEDQFGRDIRVMSGNVASRILPVKIHDLDVEDKVAIENEIGGALRAIEFIYKETGVNRPLKSTDSKSDNQSKIDYRNQVNKVANAIKEILIALKGGNPSKPKAETPRPDRNRSFTGGKKVIALTGFVILLIAASYFLSRSSKVTPSQPVENSIAVLPFNNLTTEKEHQFFADGVMEDILTQLQKMGELKVKSRTSVEQYRNSTKSLLDIGSELRVKYILEGSVRKSGSEIMITAQLINAGDDSHLWADNFKSSYTADGLFEIQRKIAERIVSELRLTISPADLTTITKNQTSNTEAYEHFQRGREYHDQNTNASMSMAIDQFKKAIKADPEYASAFGWLSSAYALYASNFGNSEVFMDSAEWTANSGLKLDSNCDYCYKGLSHVRAYQDQSEQSVELMKKAFAINPNNTNVGFNLVRTAMAYGELQQTLLLLDRLLPIEDYEEKFLLMGLLYEYLGEPLQANAYLTHYINFAGGIDQITDLSFIATYHTTNEKLGDLEKFKVSLKRLVEIRPRISSMKTLTFYSLWFKQDYHGIVQFVKTNHLEDFGDEENILRRELPKVGLSAQRAGDQEMTRAVAAQILRDSENFSSQTTWHGRRQAMGYLLLQKKKESLKSLERAVDTGYLYDLTNEREFESLRGDPEFERIVEKQKQRKKEALRLVDSHHFPKPGEI